MFKYIFSPNNEYFIEIMAWCFELTCSVCMESWNFNVKLNFLKWNIFFYHKLCFLVVPILWTLLKIHVVLKYAVYHHPTHWIREESFHNENKYMIYHNLLHTVHRSCCVIKSSPVLKQYRFCISRYLEAYIDG